VWFEQRFEVAGRLHALGRVKALFRGPRAASERLQKRDERALV
jgi:hypothetical protein